MKDGEILEYDETTPEFLYSKPLYDEKMKSRLSIEAQRLLMYSNKDYEKVRKKLQKLGRAENRASVNQLSLKSKNLCININSV